MNKHIWITAHTNSAHTISPLAIFTCQNCRGVKISDFQGKFHYFYRGRTQHC